MIPVAFAISGSDSSGGAGIQADLKTFSAFGVYGAGAITALTAQNTRGVHGIFPISPDFVARQIDAVLDDLEVRAIKTGMLAQAPIIEAVCERLRAHRVSNVVVDPVMVAAGGDLLLDPPAVARVRELMLPLAALVTPNLGEAQALTGRPVGTPEQMREAARALVGMGAGAALVKGGRLTGDAIDIFYDGYRFREFSVPRIRTTSTHGTGCTLSAAVAAGLALGQPLEAAVQAAKDYVTRAIAAALPIGHGIGPVNHLVPAQLKKAQE
jgi:hydroxymethylpyrimidine/phosphomethylpyrimidine kinase